MTENPVYSQTSSENWKNANVSAYSLIALKIRKPVRDTVKEIIEMSNKKKIIFHGVKYPKYASQIERSGLKPMTRGIESCSFWATGLALFEPDIDSPFFNYSGNYSMENPELVELTLVAADYDSLAGKGIRMSPYSPDGQVLAYDCIPPEELTLLKVKKDFSDDHERMKPRKQRQFAEHDLLRAIHAYLIINDEKEVY